MEKETRRKFLKRLVFGGTTLMTVACLGDFIRIENNIDASINSMNPNAKGEERLKLREQVMAKSSETPAMTRDILASLVGGAILLAYSMPYMPDRKGIYYSR